MVERLWVRISLKAFLCWLTSRTLCQRKPVMLRGTGSVVVRDTASWLRDCGCESHSMLPFADWLPKDQVESMTERVIISTSAWRLSGLSNRLRCTGYIGWPGFESRHVLTNCMYVSESVWLVSHSNLTFADWLPELYVRGSLWCWEAQVV